MTQRITILLILTFLSTTLLGQPGGGGGLNIRGFYNKQFEKINLDDSTFKARAFALVDSSINSKIIQEIFPLNYHRLPRSFSNYQTDNYIDLANQRLLLTYKNDTMLVDFYGIPPANGAGYVDHIDSIVFQRGYFRYFLKRKIENDVYLDDSGYYKADTLRNANQLFKLSRYGVTPFTVNFFSNYVIIKSLGRYSYYLIVRKSDKNKLWIKIKDQVNPNKLIEHYNNINIHFLSEENIPSTFYLRRGTYYVSQKNFEPALEDIFKSIEMGLTLKENEESLLLLCNVYEQINDYDRAIKYISDLINLRSTKEYYRINYGLNNIKDNYRKRIELFINKGQFDKALIDFDSLVSVSKFYHDYLDSVGYVLKFNEMYSVNEYIKRAEFKMNYLKDYKGAEADLKDFINKIPDKPEGETPQGVSVFNKIYFILALAEYNNGDLKSAFKHWLKAEELWYGYQNYSEKVIVHFDTLINKHPKIAELHLARAIANYLKATSLQESEDSKIYHVNSLKDLAKSEEYGLTDFRINIYRAYVLFQQKKYEAALEQINIAVSKNDNDPRVYISRYWIRDKLGEVKNRDKNTDPDWIKYTELTKSWKFEK